MTTPRFPRRGRGARVLLPLLLLLSASRTCFAGPPLDPPPGLLLHLAADDGVVADTAGCVMLWRDLSAAKAHCTQPVRARMPRLVRGVVAGRPAVRFSGGQHAGQSVGLPEAVLSDAGASVVLCARVRVRTFYGSFCWYGAESEGFSLRQWSNGGRLSGGAGKTFVRSAGGDLAGQGFKVFAFTVDKPSGLFRLHENGALVAESSGPVSWAAKAPFTVGAMGSRYGMEGDVAELLLFNRPLKDGERRRVEEYLLGKYGLPGTYVSPLAPLLPFAYYPSRNRLAAAVDADTICAELSSDGVPTVVRYPAEAAVRVVSLPSGTRAASGSIALDGQGRGQGEIALPDLPDGEYAVEYVLGDRTIRSPKTFRRIRFPWEGNRLGDESRVYPPFEPPAVRDRSVSVVGRTYRVNGFGLFDSVVSLGRELLAAPMALRMETADGRDAWARASTSGRSVAADRAEFDGRAVSGPLAVSSRVVVEEDGCARVELRLSPGEAPREIRRLWIEIPLREKEVPYFHYAADRAMRHNYAGALPGGGRIVWDLASQFWCPVVWKAEPGPADGAVWDSSMVKRWRDPVEDYRPFVPYIWLGAEERGLAWFGENEAGYAVPPDVPVQEVVREGDRVVLRVRLVARPFVPAGTRTIVFGLQATPAKPMEPGWRSRPVATGIGPVNCWGGYLCASKYPDDRDYGIVDKIQEARRTGVVDEEYFRRRDAARAEKDRKVNDGWPWLDAVLHFAREAKRTRAAAGTYFEEHAIDVSTPEWRVFQDEWGNREFDRFQPRPGNWGTFPRSYADFCLFHANEWMKRGVSLYFDNANIKRSYNPASSSAFVGEDGGLRFTMPLWDQRAYYKRIWKLSRLWNGRGAPYPLDVTFHMTNTQVVPFNVWTTATLDLEQRYRKDEAGANLPWPPDYTRTVTLSRTVGSVPYALDPLRSGAHTSYTSEASVRELLANWGMHRVHEVRGDPGWPARVRRLAGKYQAILSDFGYPESTVVHNYWDEKPFLRCSDERVRWLAATRERAPGGFLILQNYAPTASTARVAFPGAGALYDIERREVLRADGRGEFAVGMPDAYGTRAFLAGRSPADLPRPAPARGPGVLVAEDFEFGAGMDWTPLPAGLSCAADGAGTGNAVLRIAALPRPAALSLEPDVPVGGDYELSLRLRLPSVPAGVDTGGLLAFYYRRSEQGTGKERTESFCRFTLDVDERNGSAAWSFSPVAVVAANAPVPFASVQTDMTNKGLSHGRGPRRTDLGRVDTDWHTLTVRAAGTRHEIVFDGKAVFEGEHPAVFAGGVWISSHWRLCGEKPALPFVEIDDISLRKAGS